MIFTQNTKLAQSSTKDLRIMGFALEPVSTCPFAKDCKAFCYARKGLYRTFKDACQSRWERNLAATKTDFAAIHDEIRRLNNGRKALAIRIHTEGDFYNKAYAMKWLETARAFPDVRFYAYSKSWRYFVGVRLPSNLNIIASEGGRDDAKLSTWKGPIARVVDTMPRRGINGSDDDKVAMMAKGRKVINIIKH